MAKKIFTFRGKKLEELQQLSVKEVAELLPSRQRRSITRGLSVEKEKLMKKLEEKGKAKTHIRDMIVLPNMVGKTVGIHNGKEFVQVTFTEEMIGMFFGELALTRRKVGHSAPGVGATKSSSALSVR